MRGPVKPYTPAAMLSVTPRLQIPLREFRFSYSRSSGPGGQNVNKLNTRVSLRWDVVGTSSLPEDVRTRFCERFRRRISGEGELLVTSQRFRDQGRNVADCLEKLRGMLEEVATPPRPRRKTRPSRAVKERRLREKKQHSERKQRRRRPGDD